jgi:hypothetical protein
MVQAYGAQDSAVSAFFDNGGAPEPRARAGQGAGGGRLGVGAQHGGRTAPPIVPRGGAGGKHGSGSAAAASRGSASASAAAFDLTDDDGVRAADAQRTERLMEPTPGMGGGGGRGREPPPPVHAFKGVKVGGDKKPERHGHARLGPPTGLLAHGLFGDVVEAAKAAQRWLLVNIQNKVEFECMQLNRDVWRDAAVEDIVSTRFLLWQADLTHERVVGGATKYMVNPSAGGFMQAYRIGPGSIVAGKDVDISAMPSAFGLTHAAGAGRPSGGFPNPIPSSVLDPDSYPVIALIDPRSRELLWLHRGHISAEDMQRFLSNFLTDAEWEDVVKPVKKYVTKAAVLSAEYFHGNPNKEKDRAVDITKACTGLWSAGGASGSGSGGGEEDEQVAIAASMGLGAGQKRERQRPGREGDVVILVSDEEEEVISAGAGLKRARLEGSSAASGGEGEEDVYEFEYVSDEDMGVAGAGAGAGGKRARVQDTEGAAAKRAKVAPPAPAPLPPPAPPRPAPPPPPLLHRFRPPPPAASFGPTDVFGPMVPPLLQQSMGTGLTGQLQQLGLEGRRRREVPHGLLCALPPEPGPGEAGVVQIAMRLRSGARLVRRFRTSDPVCALYLVAAHETGEAHSLAAALDVHLRGYCGAAGSIPTAFAPLKTRQGLAAGDTWDLVRPPPSSASLAVDAASSTVGEAGLGGAAITLVPLREVGKDA